MNEIVLASRNPNKIHELRELLSLPDLRVLSTADFPELEEVDEDALTLEGNALKKAHYVAMVTLFIFLTKTTKDCKHTENS